jgi:Tol biopolymer transport system component
MFCPYCGQENENENTFCMFCGKSLSGQVENSEQAAIQHKTTPSKKRPDKPFLLYSVIAIGALFMAAVLLVNIIIAPNLFSPLSGGEILIYSVQERSITGPFSAIVRVNADGKNPLELAHDRDGYYPTNVYRGFTRNIFSTTGKNFVMREKESSGDLMLFADDGSIPIYLGYRGTSGISEGFSPDGKYFAYTHYDLSRNEIATHVYDIKGNQLLTLDGAVFGAFLPDGNKMVVIETDIDRNVIFSGLAVIDINRGEISFLTEFDDTAQRLPLIFVSSDSRQVYFVQSNYLASIPINGGAIKKIYEFESPNSQAFLAPDKNNLVILDAYLQNDSADLILFDPQTSRRVRIDKDLNLYHNFHAMYGEAPIKFSPDGKFLAYMVTKDRKYDLYITNIETRQRSLMVGGSEWISFEFSPDKKRIAYIDGRSGSKGGNLFVREYDGSNRIRLDTDVWSFQFDQKGRSVYYFKVDNLGSSRAESEMYKINMDAKNKKVVLPADKGIMSFLSYQNK